MSSLRDEWTAWKQKLLKLARIELSSRPAVKKLVLELDASSDCEGKLIVNCHGQGRVQAPPQNSSHP